MTEQIINNNEESQQLYEHHNFTVDLNQSTIRIDKFLFDKLPNVTRNKLQEAIKNGFIKVNEKEIKSFAFGQKHTARTIPLDTGSSGIVFARRRRKFLGTLKFTYIIKKTLICIFSKIIRILIRFVSRATFQNQPHP